jgi:transposase
MSRTRRHFTDEFKREAVRLCKEPGASVAQIAQDVGVGDSVLRRWVRLTRDGAMEMDASKPLRAEALSEVQRLQRELKKVTMEHDILKKYPQGACPCPKGRNSCRSTTLNAVRGSGRSLFGDSSR